MSRFFTSPSSASTSSSCSLLLLSHIIIVIGAPDGDGDEDGDDCLASCVRFWGHWVKSQAIYLRELHGFFTCCLRPVGAVVAARDDIDIIIRRVPRARRRQTERSLRDSHQECSGDPFDFCFQFVYLSSTSSCSSTSFTTSCCCL